MLVAEASTGLRLKPFEKMPNLLSPLVSVSLAQFVRGFSRLSFLRGGRLGDVILNSSSKNTELQGQLTVYHLGVSNGSFQQNVAFAILYASKQFVGQYLLL